MTNPDAHAGPDALLAAFTPEELTHLVGMSARLQAEVDFVRRLKERVNTRDQQVTYMDLSNLDGHLCEAFCVLNDGYFGDDLRAAARAVAP